MNKMEEILSILQDLRAKQEKTKSELDKNKEDLIDKIEGNFDMTLNQLRQNRQLELKMVEQTFAETEAELREGMDSTNRILDHLRKITDAPRESEAQAIDSGVKNELDADHSKADRKEFYEMQASSATNESEQGKEVSRPTDNFALKSPTTVARKDDEIDVQGLSKTLLGVAEATVYSSPNSFGLNAKKLRNIKYRVKIHGSYNIRRADDSNVCDINGICCLENGGVVLADTQNARLKLLDSNFNLVSATEDCKVISAPFGICHLHDEKFVFSDNSGLTGYLKYLSIDKTGNMKFIKALSTGTRNWSVVFQENCIYIMGRQKLKGSRHHYRLHKYSENGGSLAGGMGIQGEYMSFSNNGSRLYVTKGTNQQNQSNDVTIIDCKTQFEERCTFWHPDLKMPCGVVVDENDQVFVCGLASKNVLHFDEDGNKVGVLLAGKDFLDGPKCLGYDKTNHRLIVAGNADEIKVLDLEQV